MGWLCTELQFSEAGGGSFLESGVPALISKTRVGVRRTSFQSVLWVILNTFHGLYEPQDLSSTLGFQGVTDLKCNRHSVLKH